ncbi:hypothetical protein D3C81_1508860 [compost metagenome]
MAIFNHNVIGGTYERSSTNSATLSPIYSVAYAQRLSDRNALYAKYPVEQVKLMRRTLRSRRYEHISDAQVLAALDKSSRIVEEGSGKTQS